MNLHKLFHLSVSFLSVKGLDTCLLLIRSLLQGVLDIPWALWEVKHAVRAEATERSAAPLHACLLNTAMSCKAHAHCKLPDAQLCSEHHCCCQMLVWQQDDKDQSAGLSVHITSVLAGNTRQSQDTGGLRTTVEEVRQGCSEYRPWADPGWLGEVAGQSSRRKRWMAKRRGGCHKTLKEEIFQYAGKELGIEVGLRWCESSEGTGHKWGPEKKGTEWHACVDGSDSRSDTAGEVVQVRDNGLT